MKKILITGGSGFVGSTLAIQFKKAYPNCHVVALDNLKRRGSEWIYERLRKYGITFLHGDVRCPGDFPQENFDVLIEGSAEPSVLAGYHNSPDYVIGTNLSGALHCFEWCRHYCPQVIFLSTSRIYPIRALTHSKLIEKTTRFEFTQEQELPGISNKGIRENFPLTGHRSLYGATKLAAELMLEEYQEAYGLQTVINRCGMLAGPWQMGKSDQGVFTFWLFQHLFHRPLQYIGFGGQGKQSRDLLYAEDLAQLVLQQVEKIDAFSGKTFNVGGGYSHLLSLQEATAICAELTGHQLSITADDETRLADIPVYYSDNTLLYETSSWRPHTQPQTIFENIYRWACSHRDCLEKL